MATFTADRPPLAFGPHATSPEVVLATTGAVTLSHQWNERDVYPVFLEAGTTYQVFVSGSVNYAIWDDFARQVVQVDAEYYSAGFAAARAITALSIEQSGLHYLVVDASFYIKMDWSLNAALGSGPLYTYYSASLYPLPPGEWGPNRTPTSLGDSLGGGAGDDVIGGFAGDDTIRGLDGNDSIGGGPGDDDLNGNLGNDWVRGGPGRDFVRGGQGDDFVFGEDGDDWHVNGNIGNDLVYGDSGDDALFGGPGFDRLYGGPGNDTLSGDLGNDSLYGDLHADRFDFGDASGQDSVYGFDGGGGDRIHIAAGINGAGIADFEGLADRITVEAGGTRLDLGEGNNVLFVGAPAGTIWSGVVEFG